MDQLLEVAEENRRRREREGPWIGKHTAQRCWTSSQAGDCYHCRGRGSFPTIWGEVQCLDCDGKGRVIHCVACAGRGVLWLGGSDYLGCPECNETGAYHPPKHTVGITVAGRSSTLERKVEHANLSA